MYNAHTAGALKPQQNQPPCQACAALGADLDLALALQGKEVPAVEVQLGVLGGNVLITLSTSAAVAKGGARTVTIWRDGDDSGCASRWGATAASFTPAEQEPGRVPAARSGRHGAGGGACGLGGQRGGLHGDDGDDAHGDGNAVGAGFSGGRVAARRQQHLWHVLVKR